LKQDFTELKKILQKNSKFTFLSGAGLSTSSGLPDFRSDPDGFWKKNTPVTFQEFQKSEMSRIKSWTNNFEILNKIRNSSPSNMHNFINKILSRRPENIHIAQNIDGLHRSHKFKDQIVEIHGSVHTSSCLSCNKQYETLKFYEENILKKQNSNCNSCKDGLVKVDTISFGQALSQISLKKAQEASENCDFFIAVGTSLKVSPANQFPNIALQNNAKLIILNKEETSFDGRALLVINEDLEEIHEQIN
tara:strand:- start:2170 stop:2913 length:744 start_codon:yes stop_codon:yes gene_type:complete